ncbi:MAG: Pr6Pr family membrane protein [Microbacterium ginsengisoli]|jgi:hypothetical protein|uniref:Pr6Pr family membrane protein n=2 Tax=Microbacteriaceae TaxID=85023 RepID=UPI0006F3F7D3|nr:MULTISPECIES: Pr6Pr family membrane protein [unclassified Microbacterium]KQR92124.1 hypothetical protein ASF93_05860 [Microbacterium sp. Leaf347]MBN9197737.1 Pr6Pr family membrane protein [Microbacterium ginsengisoli]OJU79345.1 MAG: hypothetical protein BGO15_10575 [Microbacterium sp. 71-23]
MTTLQTPGWARTWTLVRAAGALIILTAIIGQAEVTFGGAIANGLDVGVVLVNFFSFFTILSNVGSVVILAAVAVWSVTGGRGGVSPLPRGLAVALACVSTYMIITGIVYNTLLRGIPLPQGTTVEWANEILHVVGPIILLADVLVGARVRSLGWRVVPIVLAFPIVWVVYTLVRGPLVTNPNTGAPYWYPYPFLDPNAQASGYAGVALWVAIISAAFIVVGVLVVWVGRLRTRS